MVHCGFHLNIQNVVRGLDRATALCRSIITYCQTCSTTENVLQSWGSRRQSYPTNLNDEPVKLFTHGSITNDYDPSTFVYLLQGLLKLISGYSYSCGIADKTDMDGRTFG